MNVMNTKSNKYIYILSLVPKYTKSIYWIKETEDILQAHFDYLKKLNETGQLYLAGKTAYTMDHHDNFGIVIFQSNNAQIADELMNNDPAVKEGIMQAQLHPFSIALIKEPLEV